MSELPWPKEWCEPMINITVKGDCGKIHSSFEEWQKCYACGPVEKELVMAEKINKHYKPHEFEAARDILFKLTPHDWKNENCEYLLKELFNEGYRLVKIPK